MEVCRPGGDKRNVYVHLDQEQVYSGYYKAHGLKYISLVLPNGIHVVYPVPFYGKEADPTIF
eukprot:2479782-Rhodomonas_salina.1